MAKLRINIGKEPHTVDYHLTEGEYEILTEARYILEEIERQMYDVSGMLDESIEFGTLAEKIELVTENKFPSEL